MFKPFLLLTAVVSFAIAITPISARPPQGAKPAPASKSPGKAAPQSLDKAKTLYKIDCALCHGDNGDGKTDVAKDMGLTLNDWTNPVSLAGKPDQELFDVIRNGKGKMPPEGEARAKDEDVRSLITYIRSMAKEQPATSAAPAAPPAPNN